MPELPDVEAFRRRIAAHVPGQPVQRVTAPDADVVRNTSVQALGRALAGRTFGHPDRHGKWLFARTDGPTVVLHFGMTGYPTWAGHGSPRHRYDRVVFVCRDGELRLNLMRKLGGVWLAGDEEDIAAITGPLGPDAREVSRGRLGELLAGRRGGIKSALMNQKVMAGVRNEVADETLWHARLHPGRKVADLTGEDLDRLHAALDHVLERSIAHGRIPRDPGWLTHAREVEQATCARCGGDIVKGTVNSRPTYWCPACQPAP